MNRLVIAAICALFLAPPAPAQQSPAPIAINAAAESRLTQDIPALMQKAGIPGLSIAILRDGHTVYLRGFGVRDASKPGELVTPQTMFNVGSLSKPVFAYGVLMLVEAGRLKLDEPLAPYLPKEFTVGDPRFQLITARIVLTHSTGFPNWPADGQPLKINFTPGERFSYSGSGMVLLQKAVEKITGKPLNEYMQQAVFTPLGMTHSSYIWQDSFTNSAAIGHDVGGSQVPLFKAEQANSAASLETTAEDYANFLNAILNRKGLKPSTFDELEKPQIAVDPACENCVEGTPSGKKSTTIFWGLGFGIEQTAQGESLWHWGDNGPYKAFFVIRPATKSGVVYFTNSENGLSIGRQLFAETLGGDQPAFDWLGYDNYGSPAIQFAQAIRKQPTPAVLQQFSSSLASNAVDEQAVNLAGYWLLGQKTRNSDAILVFQENVKRHPDSWNAYDSLGEAYMDDNQKELAIKNYEKAVALNPKSTNSQAMLDKLRGK